MIHFAPFRTRAPGLPRKRRGLANLCAGSTAVVSVLIFNLAAHAADHETLSDVSKRHVGAEPYQSRPLEPLTEALQQGLEGDPASVFLPGSRLGPLTRALLKLEAAESFISPARYRIRLGQVQIPQPPKAQPLTVSLVQVDRYNLGPALAEQLERQHGPEHVRHRQFADDPHVSWRFVMSPVMGTVAMTEAAAQATIPDGFAATMDCLGIACTAPHHRRSQPPGWESLQAPSSEIETDYPAHRQQLPSPAAVLDTLLVAAGAAEGNDRVVWLGFEPREGVGPGDVFVEAVLEVGLGPESSIVGLLRDDYLMDHMTRTMWYRFRAVATAPDQPPVTELARASAPRPRMPDQ